MKFLKWPEVSEITSFSRLRPNTVVNGNTIHINHLYIVGTQLYQRDIKNTLNVLPYPWPSRCTHIRMHA